MLNSGIYCIKNLVNGKIYIGQTKNIELRWAEHLRKLRGNRHFNGYLQKSFTKYGEAAFEFSVLCYCDEQSLGDKEYYYINHFESMDRRVGYNLRAGGLSPILCADSRAKISATRKMRIATGLIKIGGYKLTDAQKHKMAIVQKRIHVNNPQLRDKQSIAMATISIKQIRLIKLLLFMDMHVDEVCAVAKVGRNIVGHMNWGDTFQHVMPKLNYYIKNRYVISQKKLASRILKLYVSGSSYQEIANAVMLNLRTIIRIVQKNRTAVDEAARSRCLLFELSKRNNMIIRLYAKWGNVKRIAKLYKMSRNTVAAIVRLLAA